MDFNQVTRNYINLKQQFDQGKMKAEEFERLVNEHNVTDHNGVRWQIGVNSGKWYRYDGQNWVEENPSGLAGAYNPSKPGDVKYPQQSTRQEPPHKSLNFLWIGGGALALGLLGIITVGIAIFLFNRQNPAPLSSEVPPSIQVNLIP